MRTIEQGHLVLKECALQHETGGLFSSIAGFFQSLAAGFAFARACEQEFHRHGRVDPEALDRIMRETAVRH